MKKNEQRSRGRKGRFVTVNDRMQTGYSYELSAPMGRNFDPDFKPELTPQQMLALGVFCCGRSPKLVRCKGEAHKPKGGSRELAPDARQTITPVIYHPLVPAAPLKGPTIREVIQPP